MIEGYPGRAHADALISFLPGDGLVTIDVALSHILPVRVVDDALPAEIATIGHDDDRARVVFDLTARECPARTSVGEMTHAW